MSPIVLKLYFELTQNSSHTVLVWKLFELKNILRDIYNQ